ncbi:MAG: hypothetical protein H6668_22475 [Ardenticatenaceae bacterium]|nr:hypothetical protein [Ardenticatenaceae bacterium]
MAKQRLQVGDAAPAGTALDIHGDEVSLATLWGDGPTFLTFLRHFG